MAQIAKLYQVEEMATDQEMDYGQRAELRKRLAYPIMCAFEKWIQSYYPKALQGGRMSKALAYTYNLFLRLSRYHLEGRYLLDNNMAENAIRPLAVGRKGYLFCGDHESAENAAIMYSLLRFCKASDVNPKEWLTDVFAKLPLYNSNYLLINKVIVTEVKQSTSFCINSPGNSDIYIKTVVISSSLLNFNANIFKLDMQKQKTH